MDQRVRGRDRADAPSPDDIDRLLALAGAAAHASERTAASIACWLAATVQVSPDLLELDVFGPESSTRQGDLQVAN